MITFDYRKNVYHFSLGENPQFDIGETSDMAPQKQYTEAPHIIVAKKKSNFRRSRLSALAATSGVTR